MTPEEIKQAKRVMLSGMLMKDGSHKDAAANAPLMDTFEESNYWITQVFERALRDGLFVCTEDGGIWTVTEKGLKFLAEGD